MAVDIETISDDETQTRILNITTDALIKKGYAGVNMNSIAQQCNIELDLLQQHFDSKSDVIQTLVDYINHKFDLIIYQPIRQNIMVCPIVCQYYCHHHFSGHVLMTLLAAELMTDDTATSIRQHIQHYFKRWKEILSDFIAYYAHNHTPSYYNNNILAIITRHCILKYAGQCSIAKSPLNECKRFIRAHDAVDHRKQTQHCLSEISAKEQAFLVSFVRKDGSLFNIGGLSSRSIQFTINNIASKIINHYH